MAAWAPVGRQCAGLHLQMQLGSKPAGGGLRTHSARQLGGMCAGSGPHRVRLSSRQRRHLVSSKWRFSVSAMAAPATGQGKPLKVGELKPGQVSARTKELQAMTVEKGLKPLLRMYGLPVSGKKDVLIKKLLDHEQGYPDASEKFTEAVKKEVANTSMVLDGFNSWRGSQAGAANDPNLKGAKIDVTAMVDAMGALLSAEKGQDHGDERLGILEEGRKKSWKDGLFEMSKQNLVRMQLEALSRSVKEVYTKAPDTIYGGMHYRARGVRIDIDMEGGALLVAAQRLREDGSVAKEYDDTMAALQAIKSPPPPRQQRGGRVSGRAPSAIGAMTEIFERHLMELRQEFDSFEEDQMLVQHFAGREGSIVRAKVVGIAGKDTLLQIMPGFVRAALPSALKVPGEKHTLGQELVVQVHQILKGAALRGKAPMVVSRNSTQMPVKMLESLVTEIKLGEIEVMAAARVPGQGSKIAVRSLDHTMNAIGLCLGKGKWRVLKMQEDLGGELVSVVGHSGTAAEFIANALFPARVTPDQVELDPDNNSAVVYVAELGPNTGAQPPTGPGTRPPVTGNLAKAIGRKGVNVKLAARLTGWNISVKEASEREADQAAAAAVVDAAPQTPPAAAPSPPAADAPPTLSSQGWGEESATPDKEHVDAAAEPVADEGEQGEADGDANDDGFVTFTF